MGSAIAIAALSAIGVACAAYGLMFVFSATKMRFHYFWFCLAAVFLAPAILVATGLWGHIPSQLRWSMDLAVLLFAAYEIVVSASIMRHFADRAQDGLDCIIVLGAQVLEGAPGRTFRRRLDSAYGYLSENPNALCIVCGAQGPTESMTEAQAGRNYLVEHGIEDARILLEERSYNTAQNMRYAAELVVPERDAVGIVTDDYHLARALAIARKSGLAHASGIAVKSSVRDLPYNIVRESIAWPKDILTGNA